MNFNYYEFQALRKKFPDFTICQGSVLAFDTQHFYETLGPPEGLYEAFPVVTENEQLCYD